MPRVILCHPIIVTINNNEKLLYAVESGEIACL
jgi:hypothetical protein